VEDLVTQNAQLQIRTVRFVLPTPAAQAHDSGTSAEVSYMRGWSGALAAPALLLIPLLCRPAPVAAQAESKPLVAQFEFGPSFGLFWPMGGWTQDFGDDEVKRRNIAVGMLGGRLTYWTSARLGIEAAVGFAPSQVALTEPNGGTEDITASVVVASVKALARLASLADGDPRDPSHWNFYAGLGAGLMARRGSAWTNMIGTTHPAIVLNIETRTPLGRAVSGRAGLEDFVSWQIFDKGLPSETRARVQHDIVFTLSALFRLGAAR